MNIENEIDRAIDLLKPDNSGKPSKAYRHLLYVIWKGDEAEIEKAIANIRRAQFFAELPKGKLTGYAERQKAYWELAENRGETPSDYLGSDIARKC